MSTELTEKPKNNEQQDLKVNNQNPEHESDQRPLKNPLLIQNIGLNTDIYALTWTALRNDVWEDMDEFRGTKITLLPENYLWLKMKFFLFIILVILTVSVLFWEVFTHDLYTPASWSIIVLRITLVTWAQKKLGPEFSQGISMLRYAFRYSDDFSYPFFASFVSCCQIFIACITMVCIILFVCMADTALELIMNFAGLSIISELDDWIGGLIVCDAPVGETKVHKNELFDLKDINTRMCLNDKLSFLTEKMEIVDDQNFEFSRFWFIKCFSYILFALPWSLLPLITLPVNYLLLKSQHHKVPIA